jgi:multidrug efflux pump subunit AcrA (membrane-fusion protein)
MKKLCLITALLLLLVKITACGAQPPVGHSEGPDLITPVFGRVASVRVERGTITEVQLLPGMVRVESEALFFKVDGLNFDAFHVYPGETVYAGQLLASLHIPHRREQVENQELHIARLLRSHALAVETWEIDFELMQIRYTERLRAAAENFDEAAMADAQRLYLEMDRARLERSQDEEWRRIERADAFARLEELREGLLDTELLAPYDGVITYISPISYGAPINTTLRILYIAPLDAPHFVEYTGPSLPNRSRVQRIVGDINGETFDLTYTPLTREEVAYATLHNLPRRTRFALPEGLDFPLGSPVRIFSYTLYMPDVLFIPANALVGTGANAYVYRMEGGTWIPVNPTFGVRTATFVEILDGLSEGDEIRVN